MLLNIILTLTVSQKLSLKIKKASWIVIEEAQQTCKKNIRTFAQSTLNNNQSHKYV